MADVTSFRILFTIRLYDSQPIISESRVHPLRVEWFSRVKYVRYLIKLQKKKYFAKNIISSHRNLFSLKNLFLFIYNFV